MNLNRVILFGKLKNLSPQGFIEVSISSEMTPQIFREEVAKVLSSINPKFKGISELNSSAVANDSRIIFENEPIGTSHEYFLLPPICGG